MTGRQSRMIPCNGNRAYKYYLEGDKVNGKRKRLCFRDDQGPGCDRSEGTVRRAGEANRSSGNIQHPMTGEDRELGELRPLFADAITRWQYRFGSASGIGCAVFTELTDPLGRDRNGRRRTGAV